MSDTVHLQAPETLENAGANVYCPIVTEFTFIGMGKSADGLETYACKACNEPEPVLREVTDAELDAIAKRLNNTQ
jgi:hypothetical protein